MSPARIELEWTTAEWEDGIADELVELIVAALESAGRSLPDLISAEVRDGETA